MDMERNYYLLSIVPLTQKGPEALLRMAEVKISKKDLRSVVVGIVSRGTRCSGVLGAEQYDSNRAVLVLIGKKLIQIRLFRLGLGLPQQLPLRIQNPDHMDNTSPVKESVPSARTDSSSFARLSSMNHPPISVKRIHSFRTRQHFHDSMLFG